MRKLHFETLQPICPSCRQNNRLSSPLVIGSVEREAQDRIEEGILLCSNEQCRHEYPVIDGIPILIADLRTFIGRNILSIFGRRDLAASTESLLGDCCGPDSAFTLQRQHLGIYMDHHYGHPAEDATKIAPAGSIASLLQKSLSLLDRPPSGPILDAGCAVGRTTFELARAFPDQLVLGVDLNFSMLVAARQILDNQTAQFPKRRLGMVYDRTTIQTSFSPTENIDFWLCDALNPPFADASFGLTACLNLLDCVHSPYLLLQQTGRILRPEATALFASPYDWSAAATPPEAWFGGHSQRSEKNGGAVEMIKHLLSPATAGADHCGLVLSRESHDIPWILRLHERSTMHYLTHLFATRKTSATPHEPTPGP